MTLALSNLLMHGIYEVPTILILFLATMNNHFVDGSDLDSNDSDFVVSDQESFYESDADAFDDNISICSTEEEVSEEQKSPKQPSVTANYVLAWFGILLMCDAYFAGDINNGINCVYRDHPYGISVPFIKNTMPRESFRFMRNFIYFSDRNDRDSADNMSLRTNRWYLRLLFCLVRRVVHFIYASVLVCVSIGVGDEKWSKYKKKKNGWYYFQIDLGMEIMKLAVASEWTDLSAPRPDWMRQTAWIPCDCKKCFFCLNGFTSGIAHKTKSTVTTFVQNDNLVHRKRV